MPTRNSLEHHWDVDSFPFAGIPSHGTSKLGTAESSWAKFGTSEKQLIFKISGLPNVEERN
jgi:hypothetical protein